MIEWIDVEEKLPKREEKILVFATPMYGSLSIELGKYCNDDFYINDRSARVTHWMPLPEPPNAE